MTCFDCYYFAFLINHSQFLIVFHSDHAEKNTQIACPCKDVPIFTQILPIFSDGTEYSSTTMSNVEPADKLNIRRYIKGVCSASWCADTFFLYISSPTRRDGNALLWDANGSGIVSYCVITHGACTTCRT